VKLTRSQVRRICYEAERAFLVACGRGGMPEWNSIPESVRTQEDRDLHPAPFHRDSRDGAFHDQAQNEMRRLIYTTMKAALEPFAT
jgi:hypothetical protein